MTPTEQAARWLADVPKHNLGLQTKVMWILEADALAAIARHLAPGDDLVKRLFACVDGLRSHYEPGAVELIPSYTMEEAAAALASSEARAQKAEEERDAAQEAHIFADAARDAAEARVAELEAALEWQACQPEAHPFMVMRARATLAAGKE